MFWDCGCEKVNKTGSYLFEDHSSEEPNMRKFIVSVILLSALSGVSHAADVIIEPDPVPPPPEVDLFTWEGAYVGVSLGYGIGNTSSTTVQDVATGNIISDREFDDSDGVIFGGFAGYNFPVSDRFLLGAEADIEITTMDDTRAILGGGVSNVDVRAQTSLRARFAYSFDQALVYATGGLAVGEIAYSAIDAAGSGNSDGAVEIGYTVGFGVDYAFTDRIFARAEYRWTDFGEEDFRSVSGLTNFSSETAYHSIRFGLGIRF